MPPIQDPDDPILGKLSNSTALGYEEQPKPEHEEQVEPRPLAQRQLRKVVAQVLAPPIADPDNPYYSAAQLRARARPRVAAASSTAAAT